MANRQNIKTAVAASSRPPEYREFLSRFLEENQGALERFARRNLRNPDHAEDVFTEVCYRVIREADKDRIDSYEEVPLRVWVFRVARNYCMDLNRQSYDQRRLDISDLLTDGRDLEHEIAFDDSIGAILDAIADLPDDNRAAVWLCRVERLKAREAAEVLGITMPALKSRLYRGVKLLRSWLSREDGGISYFRRRRSEDSDSGSDRSTAPCQIDIRALPIDQPLTLVEDLRLGGSAVAKHESGRSREPWHRPGVRPDSPRWFHHPLTPVKSSLALAKAIAQRYPARSVNAIQRSLWYAFSEQKLSEGLRQIAVETVTALARENGLTGDELRQVTDGLVVAITPQQNISPP